MSARAIVTRVLIVLFVFAGGLVATPAAAQLAVAVGPDGMTQPGGAVPAPRVLVRGHGLGWLDVSVLTGGVELSPIVTPAGEFLRVTCPDAAWDGAVGGPGLPVVRKLFQVPPGATVDVAVEHGPEASIDLRNLGLPGWVAPVQGPLSLEGATDTPAGADAAAEPRPFRLEPAAYAGTALVPEERVAVRKLGVASGMELYALEVRPVAYNAREGRVAVWPLLEIHVTYGGGTRLGRGLRAAVLNPLPRTSRTENLLIVTAPDFAGSAPLTQFANFKTGQGFNVSILTIPTGTERDAIRAQIRGLWGTPAAPDYLVIIADALNTWSTSGAYSIPVFVGGGTKHAGTDIPYACMDDGDDWIPDVPVGRMPVRTVAELQGVVDKVLYVESGLYADPSYTARATLIAGTDLAADAEARHNYIADTYLTPAGVEANRVYAAQGADTQDVLDAFNAGCFVGVYLGHADGYQAWWTPYFTNQNVDELTNLNLYPFVMSFSCSCSVFHFTGPTTSPGLLEHWLHVPGKGAAATYGTTTNLNPYAWSTWGNLYNFVFEAIYTDGLRELGPACREAALDLVAFYGPDDPVSRDHTESFLLLGDPSMRLPEPPAPNYLLIVPSGYATSAAVIQLSDAKAAQGFNVSSYVVPSGTHRTAIRDHILSLIGTKDEPDYILIIGDTAGENSTTTTIPHWVGLGSKAATTDLPYGCVDPGDDWYPEIPVGRFPAASATQLQAMVDKTLYVEGGLYPDPDYPKRVAFLANPDTYNTAEPTAEWIISHYLEPNGYVPIRIYAAQGGDTQDVFNALNDGCVFATYMGHSGSSGWWDPAFNQGNIAQLNNTGLYPVVLGWSCNTAHFDYAECFGETWLRTANRGAAVYISASNYIYWGSVEAWEPSGILERAFFTALFEDDLWRAGPAWHAALYRFLEEYGQPGTPGGPPTQNYDVIRNFFEEFVILGDPALKIPRPNGFRIHVTPASQELCSPPETAAMYTVTVEQIGTFEETVTLSLEGAPPGSNVSFSNNGLSPPFIATLTLGNLSGPPGAYPLTITGVSATKLETGTATLHLATADPGAVVLTSPPDGAVEVARKPTLTWQPAPQAAGYDVEISANVGFTNIVYVAHVTDTTTTVDVNLDTAHVYYWHVRGVNGCGPGEWSTVFDFTTAGQADYFTQQFEGGFDLQNTTLTLVPDNSADYYHLCGEPAAALPTDPAGGTALTLSDDGSQTISFGITVKLYGVPYTSARVNANGNITFEANDGTWQETLAQHFALPRVAAVFDDLNPATGGQVSWKQLPDRIAVTWLNVPEYETTNQNTFQIEMFAAGDIRITWLTINAADCIVGLSEGQGLPPDFVPTDLSQYQACVPPGACCISEVCYTLYEEDCAAAGGTFLGSGTGCDPDPCVVPDTDCLIISEVVQGAESGDCPRWIEITNTGSAPFLFLAGGLIVQTGSSTDVEVDVSLAGVQLAAGQSFVIASNSNGACTGAYYAIYGQHADLYTNVPLAIGTERLILTDTADGSHLLDIYGEFGVNGAGRPWEFTRGYSYRKEWSTRGTGGAFNPAQWFFGGVDSLSGPEPTQLLLAYTTPRAHVNDGCDAVIVGDLNCDGQVGFADINPFIQALTNPSGWEQLYPGCTILAADVNGNGTVGFDDINPFVTLLTGGR